MRSGVLSRNPFRGLTRFEQALWLTSLVVVGASFVAAGQLDPLTVAASLVGVTALILIARGDVWGQILVAAFGIMYAIISIRYHYYGEAITYLGMSVPITVATVVAWLRHPHDGTHEVKVHQLSAPQRALIAPATLVVTIGSYFVLAALGTANLWVSTVSIATSFAASYLLLFRSPYYALAYAVNDVVLIVLWVLASIEDPAYLPMVACFTMFLANDAYGFYNWFRMKERQRPAEG